MILGMFGIIIGVLAMALYLIYRMMRAKRAQYPPGPNPWPLFGNVLQLDRIHPEYTLLNWRQIYGPIFLLWLPLPTIILGEHELIKRTFGQQGEIFAGRPQTELMRMFFGGNYGLMMNKNELYRKQRRFALHSLKQFGFSQLEVIIAEETQRSLSYFYDRADCTDEIDVWSLFTVCNGNVINRILFGKALNEAKLIELKLLVQQIFADWINPSWMLVERFPWLRYLEHIGIDFGFERAMEVNTKFITFIRDEIKKHRITLDGAQPPSDVTDSFLLKELWQTSSHATEQEKEKSCEWQTIISLYDLWSAGIETTVAAMQYAVLFALHFPDVQKKLHTELDDVIDASCSIKMSDQKRLPYLSAFIQEVLRVANIVPLSLTHETLEDTMIAGYRITKGTAVIAQLACINLDPSNYEEPLKFDPTRHLDKANHFVKDQKLNHFSYGRRSCLGEGIAKMQLFLVLGTLFRHLTFLPIDRSTLPPIAAKLGLVRTPDRFNCYFRLRT